MPEKAAAAVRACIARRAGPFGDVPSSVYDIHRELKGYSEPDIILALAELTRNGSIEKDGSGYLLPKYQRDERRRVREQK